MKLKFKESSKQKYERGLMIAKSVAYGFIFFVDLAILLTFIFSEYFRNLISGFISIDITFLVLSFVLVIFQVVETIKSRCSEDKNRLTTDYEDLMNTIYPLHLYKGEEKSGIIAVKNTILRIGKEKNIPIIFLGWIDKENEISIEYNPKPKKLYEVPQIIQDHTDEILAGYKYSKSYNAKKIRLDRIGFSQRNKSYILYTSPTYFYNTLLTNRASDLVLNDHRSVRDILEPGPFLSELADSQMSNQLGFNCVIVLKYKDKQWILFSYRDRKQSTGKKKWDISASGCIEPKYCLKRNGNKYVMKEYGVEEAIYEGIKKELEEHGINSLLEDIDKSNRTNILQKVYQNIIAIYRDLVESGLPQLLVVVSAEVDKSDFKKLERNQESRGHLKYKLIPFSMDMVNNMVNNVEENYDIFADRVSYIDKGKKEEFLTLPTVSGSFALFLKYVQDHPDFLNDFWIKKTK